MRIDDFPLAWRWTQKSHAVLPTNVLATLEPIDGASAHEFYRRGENAFRDALAENESSCRTADAASARAWLRAFRVPADSTVTAVWNRELGLRLPWGVFVQYWDDFCYPSSDDVFVFLPSGSEAISYEHYEVFRYRSGVA